MGASMVEGASTSRFIRRHTTLKIEVTKWEVVADDVAGQ